MADQLEILKRTELRLVKEFHRLCEQNHLRYVLAFGTMIGAVRHNGFIPWDDDIDVVMPWEDYCIFALDRCDRVLQRIKIEME